MDSITRFVKHTIARNWLQSGVIAFLLQLGVSILVIAIEPHGQYAVAIFNWINEVLLWIGVICLAAFAYQLVTNRIGAEAPKDAE